MADHGALINSREFADPKAAKEGGTSLGPLGTLGGRQPRYREDTYEDGTKIVFHWSPDANSWNQDSIDVDPNIAAQFNREHPKPGPDNSASQAETARHNKATENQAIITAARSDRRENSRDRTAQTQAEAAQIQAKTAASREQILAKGQELQNEIASGRLKREQAQQQFDEWYKTEVSIPNERARIAIEQQNANTSSSNSALANKREDRVATQQERQTKLDEQKFGYQAGQDAVTNARLADSRTIGSGQFAQHLGDFLSGGAGAMPHFSADDLRHQAPDYNAIAEAAAKRALDSIGYRAPGASAPPPAPGAHPLFDVAPANAVPPPVPSYQPSAAAAPPATVLPPPIPMGAAQA